MYRSFPEIQAKVAELKEIYASRKAQELRATEESVRKHNAENLHPRRSFKREGGAIADRYNRRVDRVDYLQRNFLILMIYSDAELSQMNSAERRNGFELGDYHKTLLDADVRIVMNQDIRRKPTKGAKKPKYYRD